MDKTNETPASSQQSSTSTAAVSDLAPQLEDLAQRSVTTLETGDMDGWLAAFADDGVLWHSSDGSVMTAKDNAELVRHLYAEVISEQHYEGVRRYQIDGGYVQQHSLRIAAKTGATHLTGVCLVVKVADGRVQRLDEYLDSSVFQFAAQRPGAAK